MSAPFPFRFVEVRGERYLRLEAWTMPLDKALEADWALSGGWGFVTDAAANRHTRDRRRAARARCAEILNARKVAP